MKKILLFSMILASCTAPSESTYSPGNTIPSEGIDPPADGCVEAPGYICERDWMGSTFAVTDDSGSTIDSSSTTGFPLSFSGTVQPKADYNSFAMLGFNVLEYDNGLVSSWAPSEEDVGLTVNVSNPGGSEVRVQIEGQTKRWGFKLEAFDQDITIPWGDFNTACWDNSGEYYFGQLLKSIAVVVPGDNVSPRPYSVSLNSVRSGGGGSNLGTGGGSSSNTGGSGVGSTGGSGGGSSNTGGSGNTGNTGGGSDSCPIGSWTRVDCGGLSAYVYYNSSGTGSIVQPDCNSQPNCPQGSTIWFNWSKESETSVLWTYTSYDVCGTTSGIELPPPESVSVSCSGDTLTQAGQTWTKD